VVQERQEEEAGNARRAAAEAQARAVRERNAAIAKQMAERRREQTDREKKARQDAERAAAIARDKEATIREARVRSPLALHSALVRRSSLLSSDFFPSVCMQL
jgi:hypothetical protein